jgi:hypothetical protein
VTPTSRSLAVLRELGYTAEVVERWNSHTKTRKDLFGAIDIVAVHPDFGCLGIQATTRGNASKRLQKAAGCPQIHVWLAAGCKFQVWSWAKQGPRGAQKKWTLKIEEMETGGEG